MGLRLHKSVSGVRMQFNQSSTTSDDLGNKLVKHVFWGISLIGLMAFFCSLTNVIETILIIEIATTISALLVSTICLVHLYREHRALSLQEQHLIQVLLKQIQQQFTQLPPLWLIEETVRHALDAKEGELRLKALSQYRLQPALLNALVQYCKERHADHAVLVDLGLCWD